MTVSRPVPSAIVARWHVLELALPRMGLFGYALVWLVPVLALTWRIVGGTLAGDLFEHAAAVRELATHPFQPGNPILLVDLPHTLFSPYSLLAATVVRLTGMDPFNVLALAGFVNVVVLAAGFRAFVRIFSSSVPALILAAIFAFFLWGSAPLHLGTDPWIWSGFLNLNSLSYGLPYPSALAMGLAFFALALLASYLQRGGRARLVAVSVIQTVVVVLHPYTAMFIVIGLGALLVGFGSRAEIRRAVGAVGVVGLGSVVALAWPYFSVVELLTGQVGAFDPEQREMYSAVLLRVFPALVGAPFVIARLRTSRRDPLAWFLAGLSAAYALGYLTARYTLGRELPYVIVCLDLVLAISMASIISRPGDIGPFDRAAGRRSRLSVRMIAAICLVPVLVLGTTTFFEVLTSGDQHADVEGLARQTGQYEVVLADQASYPSVPTWGGKLVAWNGALAFIPDIAQRRSQAAAFFDSSESLADRIALLHEYSVRWVIYDRQAPTSSADFVASIPGWGTPHASSPDGTYVLVAVNP